MDAILNNPEFVKDYQKLKEVTLNPERHFAKTAFEHTEMVVKKSQWLAELNNLSLEEKEILFNLSYVHDIGKIMGTTSPSESVELLSKYGTFEEKFVNLVKYHDINLPWYLSSLRKEAPSEKAWRRLSRSVNVKLLCLFMIADRIDCPGGWRENKALVWFLEEINRRNLIKELKTD